MKKPAVNIIDRLRICPFSSLRPNLSSFLPLICIILLFLSPRVALGKEGRPLAVYIKQTVPATDNKKCSEIGNKILNSNGSAVDAVTAAMYMIIMAWRYPETQKDEYYIHRGGVGNAHSDVSGNSLVKRCLIWRKRSALDPIGRSPFLSS